ncbi:MAG: hypothetical protein DIU70_005880 [Bacillota bacterium]|nr:MAG: hypothetical protein DIU70_02695 [Bacillota bacterium]
MSTTWQVIIIVFGTLLVAGVILWFTPWFQVRLYGARVGQIVKKYDLQKKAEALQRVPDPTRAKKQLQELAKAYESLNAELAKIKKVPPQAREIHEETLALNRKAAELYRMVATGGFRQKEILRRQQELQKMDRALQEKVQALFGNKKKEKSEQQAAKKA